MNDADKIAEFIRDKILVSGLGTEDAPCSLAAINLALTGRLTNEIPDCVSLVIGRAIIVLQDAMPDEVRNSAEWRDLLPLAAGTGRLAERERLAILLGWMWSAVLPRVQPWADENGFGREWAEMCRTRRSDSAAEAAWVAEAAGWSAAAAAAAKTAAEAAAKAAGQDYWAAVDVPGLLRRMIEIAPPAAKEKTS